MRDDTGRISADRPAELSTILGGGGEAAEAALTDALEQAALLLEQLKASTPRRAHHPINQQLQRADMWFEQLAAGSILDLRSCAGGAGGAMLQELGDAIIQLELFLDGIGSGGAAAPRCASTRRCHGNCHVSAKFAGGLRK